MGIKLLAFDLDGTFLYDDKSVPACNLAALGIAAERGALIVPASGRILTGIPQAIKALPALRYVITANGAQVLDLAESKSIYEAKIPLETALEIYSFGDSLGLYYDCYIGGWGYMSRRMYDDIESIVDIPGILHIIKTLRTPVDSLPEYLRARGEALQKIQFYLRSKEQKADVIAALKARFPSVCVTSSLPMNIEINSAQASKGQALTALSAQLGIALSDCIAFGDGTNDTDMLRVAGIGVAMGNAEEEVKRAADYVTATNMEDGFARALLHFLDK